MAMIGTLQAADRIGVSQRRVQAMIASGRLRATKFGRDWAIDPRDLAAVKHRRAGRPGKRQSPKNEIQ